MIHRLISSKEVIAKVFRDLKPATSDWQVDAVEWLGEVVAMVGCLPALEKKVLSLQVHNHRVALPAVVESINAVEHEGARLVEGRNQAGYGLGTATPGGTGMSYDGNYYLLNPGQLITSFETGNVLLHANILPVDKEGYPMMADNVFLREAGKWYIGSMLAGRNELPMFSYTDCETRFHEYRLRAEADISFPTPERMLSFRNAWVRLVPTVHNQDTFFLGSENPELR